MKSPPKLKASGYLFVNTIRSQSNKRPFCIHGQARGLPRSTSITLLLNSSQPPLCLRGDAGPGVCIFLFLWLTVWINDPCLQGQDTGSSLWEIPSVPARRESPCPISQNFGRPTLCILKRICHLPHVCDRLYGDDHGSDALKQGRAVFHVPVQRGDHFSNLDHSTQNFPSDNVSCHSFVCGRSGLGGKYCLRPEVHSEPARLPVPRKATPRGWRVSLLRGVPVGLLREIQGPLCSGSGGISKCIISSLCSIFKKTTFSVIFSTV